MNGVRIHYQRSGEGEVPLVLVHGSWVSHRTWDAVAPRLAASFDVVAFDRRGHGRSERAAGQGSVREDTDDLAALIRGLGLSPAWVVANSFGASIALRLAAQDADVLRGVIAHEPPLWGVIAGERALAGLVEEDARVTALAAERIAAGDHEGGARLFIEHELGPGSWPQLPEDFRATMVENALTFLDEARDPDLHAFDLAWLEGCGLPVMLTTDGEGSPLYAGVVASLAATLPRAEVAEFEGAGHLPHLTRPDAYVEATRAFIMRHEP